MNDNLVKSALVGRVGIFLASVAGLSASATETANSLTATFIAVSQMITAGLALYSYFKKR